MSIQTIVQLNDDALNNQFQIIIPPHEGQIDQTGENFRVLRVSIPERSVNMYTVHYKTQKFTKYTGKDATPNEFTFDFRVDKFWNVYKGLSDWHRLILDPVSGVQSPDYENGQSTIRVPITVNTIDATDTVTSTGWVFDGCFPSNVPGVEFDMESGEPIVVTITMQFITMNPLG